MPWITSNFLSPSTFSSCLPSLSWVSFIMYFVPDSLLFLWCCDTLTLCVVAAVARDVDEINVQTLEELQIISDWILVASLKVQRKKFVGNVQIFCLHSGQHPPVSGKIHNQEVEVEKASGRLIHPERLFHFVNLSDWLFYVRKRKSRSA